MLRNLLIPLFNHKDKVHAEIALLSLKAHIKKSKNEDVFSIEEKIEKLVKQCFRKNS